MSLFSSGLLHTDVDMSKLLPLLFLGLSLGLGHGFPTEDPQGGKNWVVIVAGSNGWYNYRHQVGELLSAPYPEQTLHDSVVSVISHSGLMV